MEVVFITSRKIYLSRVQLWTIFVEHDLKRFWMVVLLGLLYQMGRLNGRRSICSNWATFINENTAPFISQASGEVKGNTTLIAHYLKENKTKQIISLVKVSTKSKFQKVQSMFTWALQMGWIGNIPDRNCLKIYHLFQHTHFSICHFAFLNIWLGESFKNKLFRGRRILCYR